MKKYRLPLFIFLVIFHALTVYAAQGRISGEHAFTLPDWFKVSFLEIQEDVHEAQQVNKHVMLFMHIDRCPYCTRMLDENFRHGDNKHFIQQHFDVIALNIRGDREIRWDKHTTYSEKSLAKALKIIATPAIVFLNSQGKKVLQLNGYRKPSAFKQVLNYVAGQHYTKLPLIDYIARQQETVYTLRTHTNFKNIHDFSGIKGPLALLFEDESCAGCDEFHQEVLNHKDVLQALKEFTLVRLDAGSNTEIIDNNGQRTTPREWVKKLNLEYRPGTVFFDKGKEITRIEGRLYHFHYKELLRYVSGGFYQHYPTFIDYLGVRQKQLLQSGIDIDFGR